MTHTPRVRASVVASSHAVVDFFSAIIIPLVSVLLGVVHADASFGALLIAAGSLSSGLIQPFVAFAGDRLDTRWFGTLGFLVAVVAIGLVGFVREPWQLMLIQIVGSAGSGAFHPVAAAAMGRLAGARRTMGVAIFFAAGMVGSVVGSALMPFYVRSFGLSAIAWLLVPGVLLVIALASAVHSVGHIHRQAAADHLASPAHEQRRHWRAVWLLYAGNVLRFTVNMMLVQLFILHAESLARARLGAATLDSEGVRSLATTFNGPLQAAMQAGMGLGGLGLGLLMGRRHEKLLLVGVPILGGAAIACFPLMRDARVPELAIALLGGVGFAGTLPISIAMAQRLLPHRAGLASGLMMGGAWGLAGAGPLVIQQLVPSIGMSASFAVTAGVLVFSGVLGLVPPLRDLAGRPDVQRAVGDQPGKA